ncbi:MAG: SDR family oxidoreductase, partial [Pseudomonadota bacterium]
TDLAAFEGRLGVVTGAGDGIGAMLARGLADAGMVVCVQDIREDAAGRVAEEIGGGAFPLAFDVSDRDACLAAADTLKARGAPLSLLWANAGVGVGSPVLKGKPHQIEWAFGVNVLGVVWTCQAFVPLMVDMRGPRHVGFTASSAALTAPEGDFPLYALSKHGTFAMADALSRELAKDGIPSTILCPGLFNSEIWDGAKARPERFGGPRRMDPKISGMWRNAKDPAAMWPAIAANIAAGGGLLVCDPGAEGRPIGDLSRDRADWIARSIVDV